MTARYVGLTGGAASKVERLAQYWRGEFAECPLLGRPSGGTVVLREAMVMGIEYDGDLITKHDIACFTNLATNKTGQGQAGGHSRTPEDMMESLLRHAESVRSDENWPGTFSQALRTLITKGSPCPPPPDHEQPTSK